MGKIDLNHWFIGDNSLSISLVEFWVDIDIKSDGSNVYSQLKLIDSEMQTITFIFVTLDEAVDFTENVINKYRDTNKIVAIYDEKYKEEVSNIFDGKRDKMVLTSDEVEQIIMNYFGFGNGYRVSVVKEINLNRGKIDVLYYLSEPRLYSGMKTNKIRLTDKDLKNAINDYIKLYNYEVVDFEYIGKIFKSEKHKGDKKVRYDGIELDVKEKEKKLILN